MQSRNFRLQRVGDVRWLQENYHIETTARSVDELIVLNVSRSEKKHNEFRHAIEELVEKVFIPIAVGGGIRSLNVALRQKLDLYCCVRPVRWFEGVPSPVKEPGLVDMVIYRENSEDIYAGIEWRPARRRSRRSSRSFRTRWA